MSLDFRSDGQGRNTLHDSGFVEASWDTVPDGDPSVEGGIGLGEDPVTKDVEAGSEPGFTPVSVFGASNVALWFDGYGAGMRPSDGQCDDCEKDGKLCGLSKTRVLHVEAA